MELRYYRRSAYLVDNFVHIQGISVYYPSPNRIALPRKMRDNRNVYVYFASFGLNLLLGATTTLHVRHAFLNISLPSLHDYDVKCLMSRFVEDVNTRQRLSSSFSELRYSLLEFSSRKNCQDLTNWMRWMNAIKFEAVRIHFLCNVFVAVAVVVA